MPLNKPMVDWNDRNLEILRKGVAAGKSYAQIAKEIGPGVTRNATLGKAHRMGLAQPRQAASFNMRYGGANYVSYADIGGGEKAAEYDRQRADAARERTKARIARLQQTVSGRRAQGASPKPAPAPKGSAFEVTPTAVPFEELGRAMCKWPVGDVFAPGPGLYCGDKAEGDYCAHHKAWGVRRDNTARKPPTGRDLERSLRKYIHA